MIRSWFFNDRLSSRYDGTGIGGAINRLPATDYHVFILTNEQLTNSQFDNWRKAYNLKVHYRSPFAAINYRDCYDRPNLNVFILVKEQNEAVRT